MYVDEDVVGNRDRGEGSAEHMLPGGVKCHGGQARDGHLLGQAQSLREPACLVEINGSPEPESQYRGRGRRRCPPEAAAKRCLAMGEHGEHQGGSVDASAVPDSSDTPAAQNCADASIRVRRLGHFLQA